MSRSYKKVPIVKTGRWLKKKYWSIIRSRHKTEIRSGIHPQDLTNPKTIVNDWDHCDFLMRCNVKNCRCEKSYGFKKCMKK